MLKLIGRWRRSLIAVRVRRWLSISVLLVSGCGSTTESEILPWLRYRQMTSSGGTGIWSGSTTSDVAVREWWGWRVVLPTDVAPARPIAVDESSAVVFASGGVWMLHPDQPTPRLACGDKQADVVVRPMTGFVDCVDFVAGPALGVRTSVRVRRLSPRGAAVGQYGFATAEAGRVLLSPIISFYDAAHVPYFVSFIDPWVGRDDRRGNAAPERLADLRCELLSGNRLGEAASAAKPGVTLEECYDPNYWSSVVGVKLTHAREP